VKSILDIEMGILGWPGLALGVHHASRRLEASLPGLTQVKWSHYGPEFRDPLIDKNITIDLSPRRRNKSRSSRKLSSSKLLQ
jgi:hypothetical protein